MSYIVKNCPAFMKPSYCKDKCSYSITNKRDDELTYKFEFDEDSKCQDCTDCVMKQIVELCKKEKTLYEGDYIKVRQRTLISSDKILELLDVQEVK